ncbi:mitochondrial 18 KDa protein-domain-containing protein [Lipomyces japonicus]|uniref:mitochondrial 18 KDa protein-domain-containing protein n=1 Tax=Lipomyces japonicus TaxID=56871 RepID=UPI0034CD886B
MLSVSKHRRNLIDLVVLIYIRYITVLGIYIFLFFIDYRNMGKSLEQKVEDKVGHTVHDIKSGEAGESTDSNIRYVAYVNRLRIVLAAQRYVAYTSDIGESFRPIVKPAVVTTAYGISWAYVLGDVTYEGYKTSLRKEQYLKDKVSGKDLTGIDEPNVTLSVLKRGIFQSIASMGLPAFTIHSTVRYSGVALRNVKNIKLRSWGPVGLGLAVVPALPYLFDEPVEHAVDYIFEKGEQAFKDLSKK